MAKRPSTVRGNDERRRGSRQPTRGAQRRSGEAPPRRARPRSGNETAPITRPEVLPARPKNTSQAKARAKARKAKAPKVVQPPLRERLLVRLASIDLNPRTLAAKVPFVVLVIGSLGVGLGVTLWLSTDAAERSYHLGSARETNQALLQQKEALERDVLEAQAAPALAEAARNLGMIPSRDTAHLVQDPAGNWIVVGTPKPAQGGPPPPLNSPLPDETSAPPASAAARPAPRVVDPRELMVRVPPNGARAPATTAVPGPEAPSPPPAALAAPIPETPHGAPGQTPALGPAQPSAEPAPAPPLAAPATPGGPTGAEQFGPVTAPVPGAPT
jgi:hypothetical protein